MVGLARGERDSFQHLVERWERPLFAFLRQMLGSTEEAEDLAQETFVRVFEQADRYKPEGKFKSWLFRIAGNLARSRLRRRKIVQWIPFVDHAHDRFGSSRPVDQELEREEERQRVRDALAELPERQRRAILLRRYEDMPYQEIADAMGTTVAAVQTLLHRAMKNLRAALLSEGATGTDKDSRQRS